MHKQTKVFLTGNEMIAQAAKSINFHFMGYYPITPSTEIAELIDQMKARNEVDTVLLAADGEHGAAGACYGAASGGARVLNATSANGFLYSLEQLPVQSGTRLPMVLNLVTRSVSGPLDIRCDHSDLMYALQCGWIVLCASTPQALYDLNIIAVKLGEHPDVRLPVIVASDGFFTSHQRNTAFIFEDTKVVQNFIGKRIENFSTLNPLKPVTIGPYMNEPDLINNKYQLHQAHEMAKKVFSSICQEYESLSGRHYEEYELYKMQNAEYAFLSLNSSAETLKDSIDALQTQNHKVGLIKPVLLRPFNFQKLLEATKNLKKILVAERSDNPGSQGSILTHEVRSCLAHTPTQIITRVFGIGGKDFTPEDGIRLFEDLKNSTQLFEFYGQTKTEKNNIPKGLKTLTYSELTPKLYEIQDCSTQNQTKSKIKVHFYDTTHLPLKPKLIAPGHSACPGCGIFSGLDQFFKGLQGYVVALYHTGCAMVVTTDYPFSAHRITYIHNLFQNGAPTLAGLVETFWALHKRSELPFDFKNEQITFVMITGDGGMDIGMGPTIGTALRNHHMIVLEYDNQAYMNTGGQLSYTTPFAHATSTSHVYQKTFGKSFHHKDTAQIMAATGIPYVFTAIESFGTDLIEKAAKAQWYAQNKGLVFGKLLTACPLNWGSEESQGQGVLQKAVDSCFFPLYEVEQHLTQISYDPESLSKKVPVSDWLRMMKKSQHLLDKKYEAQLMEFQHEVDRRWRRLKLLHQNPEL